MKESIPDQKLCAIHTAEMQWPVRSEMSPHPAPQLEGAVICTKPPRLSLPMAQRLISEASVCEQKGPHGYSL